MQGFSTGAQQCTSAVECFQVCRKILIRQRKHTKAAICSSFWSVFCTQVCHHFLYQNFCSASLKSFRTNVLKYFFPCQPAISNHFVFADIRKLPNIMSMIIFRELFFHFLLFSLFLRRTKNSIVFRSRTPSRIHQSSRHLLSGLLKGSFPTRDLKLFPPTFHTHTHTHTFRHLNARAPTFIRADMY